MGGLSHTPKHLGRKPTLTGGGSCSGLILFRVSAVPSVGLVRRLCGSILEQPSESVNCVLLSWETFLHHSLGNFHLHCFSLHFYYLNTEPPRAILSGSCYLCTIFYHCCFLCCCFSCWEISSISPSKHSFNIIFLNFNYHIIFQEL